MPLVLPPQEYGSSAAAAGRLAKSDEVREHGGLVHVEALDTTILVNARPQEAMSADESFNAVLFFQRTNNSSWGRLTLALEPHGGDRLYGQRARRLKAVAGVHYIKQAESLRMGECTSKSR
jgi:hypothetical protein